jgi:hypothetical protein
MPPEVSLSISVAVGVVLAVLAIALNLRVQAAVILAKPSLRAGLRKGICIIGGVCFGFGLLFVIVGVLTYHGLPSWTFWPPWNFWVSAGTILAISAGIPLLVQGIRIVKTGGDLKKFGYDLRTLAKWLIIVAIVAAAIIVITPFAFWLVSLLK